MSARKVAAQRAFQKGPSLTVPKGQPVLKVSAPLGDAARNMHKATPGGRPIVKGKGGAEAPQRGK